MLPKQLPLRIKRIIAVIFYLFMGIALFEFVIDWWQGTSPFQPFVVVEPITWTIFESEVRSISIQYPEGWIVQDRPRGYGRDKEIIATISAVHPDYPRVYITYREIQTNTLKAVAEWGERRLSGGEYETISLEKIMIDDEEALLRKYYFFDSRSRRVDCYHVYLLDSSEAYTVAMCVDEKNDSPELQSVWKQMIESISLNSS